MQHYTNNVTAAISQAIESFRANGGENNNGFSLNVTFDAIEQQYRATCDFRANHNMTVLIDSNTDNETVNALWNNDQVAITNMADAMIDNNWIEIDDSIDA